MTSMLGQFWWGFELTTHFRVQYVGVLVFCALVALPRRNRWWAAIFAMAALLNVFMVVSVGAPNTIAAPITGHEPTLRALVVNVNSSNRDYPRIRKVINDYNPDFVVLLEATPWLVECLSDLSDRYPHRLAQPREDNFGIALLSRQPAYHMRIVTLGTAGLPSVVAEFQMGQRSFAIMGTHPLPPVSPSQAYYRNDQLQSVATFIRQKGPPLLLLGDLNVTPWSPYFKRLLLDAGLSDSRSGRGILPTWPVGWPLFWIPIDHILFSSGIHILARRTGESVGSDHYPVIVDFQIIGS